MKVVRQTVKPVSILLAIFMILISGPFQSVFAAMIGTETVLDTSQGLEARAYLNRFIAREDVQAALIAQNIDPEEVRARLDSLTDTEAVAIANKLDSLPAGSGAIEAILVISLIVFLVLLFTDIMGYTDIFPFVRPAR
jgi:hypothetical protein